MNRKQPKQILRTKDGGALIRQIFSKLKSPAQVFSWVKHHADDAQFKSISSYIMSDGHAMGRFVYGTPFPRSLKELGQAKNYAAGSLLTEVRWMSLALRKYAKQINEFIPQKQSIEKNIIFGEYEFAQQNLHKLEATLGMSLFVIQYRLTLAELQGGLDANAKVLSDIQSDECDPLVRLFAIYLSMRAERNVSPESFRRKVERDLTNAEFPPKLFAYYQSRLTFLELSDRTYLTTSLNSDNFLSIIDRYVQFIHIMRLLIADNHPEIEKTIPILKELTDRIEDAELLNLVVYYEHGGIKKQNPFTLIILNALEFYDCGDYERSASESYKMILEDPTNFEVYLLYVKSLILLGRTPLIENKPDIFHNIILSAVSKILSASPDQARASEDLMKIALTLSDSTLAIGIQNFLAAERLKITNLPLNALEALSNADINIRMVDCYNNAKQALDLIENLTHFYPDSFRLEVLREFYDAINLKRKPHFPKQMDDMQSRLWSSRVGTHNKEYGNLGYELNTLRKLLSSSGLKTPSFVEDEILVGLVTSALHEERLAEAAKVTVDALLQNASLSRKLPIGTLIAKLEECPDTFSPNDIYIPVLYALSEAEPRAIYIAYDNFFSAIGVTRPVAFMRNSSGYDVKLLTAFLHKVCVPKVLACSYHFESTDDLEQERLKICQHLAHLNPSNVKYYSTEINTITERIMIRRGMQQIEESKIYVDEQGIRSRGRKLFQELYERFRAFSLLQATHPNLQITDSTRILSYFVADESGALVEKPVSERSVTDKQIRVLHIANVGHFRDLFFEIRDRFISSSEHGLDAYLSTRVRHGTLEGHVRSIFERLNLVAQKDKAAGVYIEETYWAGRLGYNELTIAPLVQSLIASFTEKIDLIIEHLKQQVVQVCTESRAEKGWLDFTFSDSELIQLLTENFEKLSTYDEYIDEIFRVLWDRTNIVLGVTRMRISSEIKAQVYDALLEFLQEVRRLVRAEVAPELHGNITRGLTDLQNEFDRLAQWFTISHSTLLNEFTMSDIVRICTASINNVYPSRPIAPNVAIEHDRVYQGRFFAHFSDIFRTLFDNIIVHSGVTGAELNVQVKVVDENDCLYISVINSLSSESYAKDPVNLLKQKIKSMDELGASQSLVRTEGGTGLIKVLKILRSDLARRLVNINMDYINQNRMRMEISFELDGLLIV